MRRVHLVRLLAVVVMLGCGGAPSSGPATPAAADPTTTLAGATTTPPTDPTANPPTGTTTTPPTGTTTTPPTGTTTTPPTGGTGGGGGSNRFEIGAANGLWITEGATGVQGLLVVTYTPINGGNFIPPPDTTVTLNGVPLLRDPTLNGAYFRLDPAGPQPAVGLGGQLVLVAAATSNGQQLQRTVVFPCPADVAVASTPPAGSVLTVGGSLHLSFASDLTLNVGIAALASIHPSAGLYGLDPATGATSSTGPAVGVPAGALAVDVPVSATTAPEYLLALSWPGSWVIDGESGGFCGAIKRWTYAK